jgi:viroplasmin and RNaseH domain-containing protein
MKYMTDGLFSFFCRAMAPCYVVFEGLKPRIYTSWYECSVYVLRVEGARYQKYKNYEHALHDYNDAFKKGQVK